MFSNTLFNKLNVLKYVAGIQLLAALFFAISGAISAPIAEARFVGNMNFTNCENAPTKPTLNYWPVTFSDYDTPKCHDFPAIDAAVDDGSLGFSQSQSDWNDGLYLDAGQQGVALIYIHNGASNTIDRAQTTAKNVRITTSTSTGKSSTHTLSVTMAGDNTNTVRQSFTVKTPANSRLEVIPNSGFMYAYDSMPILDQQRLNLGNSTFNLGDLDACFEYSLFLTYKFKVITDRDTDSGKSRIEQYKEAYNDTQYIDATYTPAERGDYITYTLRTTNYGDATRSDYVIRDDLSKVLPYADIIDYGGGKRSGDSIVYPAVNIRPDQTVTKEFRVRVKTSLANNQGYRLINSYGNQVVINVESKSSPLPPVPPVTPPPIYHAPRTGSAMASGIAFASLMTSGFALFRKRESIWKFIKA